MRQRPEGLLRRFAHGRELMRARYAKTAAQNAQRNRETLQKGGFSDGDGGIRMPPAHVLRAHMTRSDLGTRSAVALAISTGGALNSFQTTPLLNVEETIAALEKARSVRYTPPGR